MKKFKNNIIGIYGEQGKEWLANLEQLSSNIAKEFGLENVRALKNLSHNYVLLAFCKTHREVVLKIGLNAKALKQEALALEALKSDFTVSILAAKEGVLLLERLDDGVSLAKSRLNNKIEICCNLVEKLHHHSKNIANPHKFPHINQQLALIDQDWDIPKNLLELARNLKNKLCNLQDTPEVLLHADLHHGNILRSGNTWKLIDPIGVVGHSINEVWAFVMDFQKDTNFIANYFNWDAQLVREWYFVHLILVSIYNIQYNISPNLFLNIAKSIYHKI